MSKVMILFDTDMNHVMTKAQMSKFDAIQLFFYAFTMYVGGAIGDIYDQRKILSFAIAGYATCVVLQSVAGFYKILWVPYYYVVFAFLGIFNSVLFPNCISIMSNWFPKKNRGMLVGMWATSNNFGNIVGIQLAAELLIVFNNQWKYLLLIIAIVLYIMATVVFFFVIPDPSQIGIKVEENEEIELVDVVEVDKAERIMQKDHKMGNWWEESRDIEQKLEQ